LKSLHCYRHWVSFCTAAAILAGCAGGSSMPLSASPATPPAERMDVRPAYSLLYSFQGGSRDGLGPLAGLMDVNGTFYGTTEFGGAHDDGTVFSITTTGKKETVLHSFKGGTDGSYPQAGLLNFGGTLYGTTDEGGADCSINVGCGTVFSITTSGTEKVLYRFKNDPDGAFPYAGLVNVKGTLYGTTEAGGVDKCNMGVSCGTVFSVTTHGKEKVLHSFGSSGDGANPYYGALLNVKGTLYGTTRNGGANSCGSQYNYSNCGTVFSITTSGTETVLYSFKVPPDDGVHPIAGLVNVNGILYGTTYFGGSTGYGTVFSITTSGAEKLLHSFKGYGDGAYPFAGLANVKGTLYGTTFGGGVYGPGAVFSITPSGKEKVLYSFQGDPDGADPVAGLLYVKSTLYGTTYFGGSGSCSELNYHGCGIVFSIAP
jgi:uncharacterized repeat protein (TIGR03803 family)